VTWDRPFDDAARDAADGQRPPRGGSAADGAQARAGLPESRTRAEYYEALRTADAEPEPPSGHQQHAGAGPGPSPGPQRQADGGPDQRGPDQRAGTETGRSGWDTVDARERPSPETIHVGPERAAHILDGDAAGRGGGHRHGTGQPGKTEFPARWDDRKVIDMVLDVARRPDQPPVRQEWNGRWVARGTRDDVQIAVVVAADGRIWTGWPLPGGAGVVKNPAEA
jgi:hypothetical protein